MKQLITTILALIVFGIGFIGLEQFFSPYVNNICAFLGLITFTVLLGVPAYRYWKEKIKKLLE